MSKKTNNSRKLVENLTHLKLSEAIQRMKQAWKDYRTCRRNEKADVILKFTAQEGSQLWYLKRA